MNTGNCSILDRIDTGLPMAMYYIYCKTYLSIILKLQHLLLLCGLLHPWLHGSLNLSPCGPGQYQPPLACWVCNQGKARFPTKLLFCSNSVTDHQIWQKAKRFPMSVDWIRWCKVEKVSSLSSTPRWCRSCQRSASTPKPATNSSYWAHLSIKLSSINQSINQSLLPEVGIHSKTNHYQHISNSSSFNRHLLGSSFTFSNSSYWARLSINQSHHPHVAHNEADHLRLLALDPTPPRCLVIMPP